MHLGGSCYAPNFRAKSFGSDFSTREHIFDTPRLEFYYVSFLNLSDVSTFSSCVNNSSETALFAVSQKESDYTTSICAAILPLLPGKDSALPENFEGNVPDLALQKIIAVRGRLERFILSGENSRWC